MSSQPKSVEQVQSETQDEIQEIMREIETLQKGMAEAADEAIEPNLSMSEPVVEDDSVDESLTLGMDDFRSPDGETSMEEMLAGMKDEEPAEGSPLAQTTEDFQAVDSEQSDESRLTRESLKLVEDQQKWKTMKKQEQESQWSAPEEGCLTMSLKGNMSLRLQYEVDAQNVTISFQDGMLQVLLADGTEFKIPLRSVSKRAA